MVAAVGYSHMYYFENHLSSYIIIMYVLHDTNENHIRTCFIMRDPSPHNAINYATKNCITLISAKISTQ